MNPIQVAINAITTTIVSNGRGAITASVLSGVLLLMMTAVTFVFTSNGASVNALSLMSSKQVADIQAGTHLLDVSGPLNVALNSCSPGSKIAIELPGPGVYGIANPLVANTCAVDLRIDPSASVMQIGSFGDSAEPIQIIGMIRINAAASGSHIHGGGIIDGNRANLVGQYNALQRLNQPGLYTIATQWVGIYNSTANDVEIDGLTFQNMMGFGIDHFIGDRFNGHDLNIKDSSNGIYSQGASNVIWHDIIETNIANSVNGIAIPVFAYANNWNLLNQADIHDIILNGYFPLHLDGTNSSPGSRIGDPYGGAFMVNTTTNGRFSNLTATGFQYNDGRANNAAWGFNCDGCYSTTWANIQSFGYYWGMQWLGGIGNSLSNFAFDGNNNIATVAGASNSAGLWAVGGGLLPPNNLSSFFDHNSMMPTSNLVVSDGYIRRFFTGLFDETGNQNFSNIQTTANWGDGVQLWAHSGGNYPAAGNFPVNDIKFDNITASYNGGCGISITDAQNVSFNSITMNDNGQESPVTGRSCGFGTTQNFGGLKTNIILSNWIANDDQGGTTTNQQFSFLPGSTTGSGTNNQYQILVANSSFVNVGQHFTCIACGPSSSNLSFKIIDLFDDFATIEATAPETFVTNACMVNVAGTVSMTANSNILTGVGTIFTSAINGPSYLVAEGQTLKIGSVINDTELQMDTTSGAAINNVTAQLIQCNSAGIESQNAGINVPSDGNTSHISIGSPSQYIATGNANVNVFIAPSSLANDWTPYVPTVTLTGGTGTSVTGNGGNYKQEGKTLCFNWFAQINYTTVPTAVSVTLPNNLTNFTTNILFGNNLTTNNVIYSPTSTPSNTANFIPLSGTLASASGQFVGSNGCFEVN